MTALIIETGKPFKFSLLQRHTKTNNSGGFYSRIMNFIKTNKDS